MAEVGILDGSRALQESDDITSNAEGNVDMDDIIDGSRERTQQDLRRMALCQLLSPGFVDLAFNLFASSCGVIWNLLKEEIALLAGNKLAVYSCLQLSSIQSTALLRFLSANCMADKKGVFGQILDATRPAVREIVQQGCHGEVLEVSLKVLSMGEMQNSPSSLKTYGLFWAKGEPPSSISFEKGSPSMQTPLQQMALIEEGQRLGGNIQQCCLTSFACDTIAAVK